MKGTITQSVVGENGLGQSKREGGAESVIKVRFKKIPAAPFRARGKGRRLEAGSL